ncbi:polysaccharide deacetylase family protein [Parabacteroides sp. OttesenSCG-928-N08]|nr:polysaccharide deacetylase family protein [Parabacteroides sp. OttesenSCG-928-N08]
MEPFIIDSIVSGIDSIETGLAVDTLLPKRGYIYLTIDDSPLHGSRYVDSVIRAAGVTANIFLVGHTIHSSSIFKRNYELLKRNPLIEIYNHSYSHANHKYRNYYKNPTAVVADFEKNRSDFDITELIARLPGRNLWQVNDKKKNYKQTGAEAAELLSQKGYNIFGWDIEWEYDAKDYTPLQTIEELLKEIDTLYDNSNCFTPDHIVLLMHDQMFSKKTENNDLGMLIRKLQERGYRFESLRSYPTTQSEG